MRRVHARQRRRPGERANGFALVRGDRTGDLDHPRLGLLQADREAAFGDLAVGRRRSLTMPTECAGSGALGTTARLSSRSVAGSAEKYSDPGAVRCIAGPGSLRARQTRARLGSCQATLRTSQSVNRQSVKRVRLTVSPSSSASASIRPRPLGQIPVAAGAGAEFGHRHREVIKFPVLRATVPPPRAPGESDALWTTLAPVARDFMRAQGVPCASPSSVELPFPRVSGRAVLLPRDSAAREIASVSAPTRT